MSKSVEQLLLLYNATNEFELELIFLTDNIKKSVHICGYCRKYDFDKVKRNGLTCI